MAYFDLSNIYIDRIISHGVGRRTEEEGIQTSAGYTDMNPGDEPLIKDFFLKGINEELAYTLSHSIELRMNEVWHAAHTIFQHESSFIDQSIQLAEQLYESQTHPNVSGGVFHVVHFKGIRIEDELVDGLGIYKTDANQSFLKILPGSGNYRMVADRGMGMKSLDKGCLIIQHEPDQGYHVLLLDKLSRSTQAKYWTEDFLQLNIVENDYHVTNRFLNLAHGFVQEQLPQDFEVEPVDRMGMLQKSLQYFKDNDKMIKTDFEDTVFEQPEVIDSFRSYTQRNTHDMDVNELDAFDISDYAVRKRTGIFKSVLKLDKNFHIYIHGDRNQIEKGVDEEGRKFYKIYYQNEA